MKQSPSGSKISTLRNQKGMTQKELADLCNVDIRTIQRIESGEVIPRMHTLKLLAAALDCEIDKFINPEAEEKKHQPVNHLKLSMIAGIIFSINYIPVIYNIITNSFDESIRLILIAIHIVTCILFFKGFYHIGKTHGNQVLEISALLAMILLPLLNIADLLKEIYFGGMIYTMFSLACVNAIANGVGFLIQANRAVDNPHKVKTYKTAGIVTLIQSVMFLSSNPDLIFTGLIISAFTNVVMLAILYIEHQGSERPSMNVGEQIFA